MTDMTKSTDDRDMLRDYLATRDVPCPLCRYNLRALQGNTCPECGHELVLKLDLADPVRGAYLTGLIALSLAVGFNGLLLLLAILSGMMNSGPPAEFFVTLFIMTLITAGFLTAWTRKSAAIRRLSAPARRVLAILCCLVPPANVIIFMILMDV